MKINPRLDLFKIQLKPKDGTSKTFHDFVRDEIDEEAKFEENMKNLFQYILDQIGTDKSNNKATQKMLRVVQDADINTHLDKKPTYSNDKDLFHGVINGGAYGRDGILL